MQEGREGDTSVHRGGSQLQHPIWNPHDARGGGLPADFVDGESEKPHNPGKEYRHPFPLKNSYLEANEVPMFTFKGKSESTCVDDVGDGIRSRGLFH